MRLFYFLKSLYSELKNKATLDHLKWEQLTSGSREVILQLEGCSSIPTFPGLHVEVSLDRILTPTLPPVSVL